MNNSQRAELVARVGGLAVHGNRAKIRPKILPTETQELLAIGVLALLDIGAQLDYLTDHLHAFGRGA